MLNIFLIILMLAGIVVFSLQPGGKTIVTETRATTQVTVKAEKQITTMLPATNLVTLPLLTGSNEERRKAG